MICTPCPKPRKERDRDRKKRLFNDNRKGALSNFRWHRTDLARAIKAKFGFDVSDAHFGTAGDKILSAELLPPSQYNTRIDEFPGNEDAKTQPGFTTPSGDIFIKDTNNQSLADTNQRLIEHEGIHSLFRTTGQNVSEAAEEAFVRDFLGDKYRQ